MEATEVRTLVPLGAIDTQRMLMPDFRDVITGEVGQLKTLSEKPGAMWQATWIAGQPWYVRLEDGSTVQLDDESILEVM